MNAEASLYFRFAPNIAKGIARVSALRAISNAGRSVGKIITINATSCEMLRGAPHHVKYEAYDLSVRNLTDEQVIAVIASLQASGFTAVDERTRPSKATLWTGPHIHIYRAPSLCKG